MKNHNEILENCDKARPEQDYTHLQEFIDNLPYIFMTILGALVFIIFVCPYCHFYDTRACPCGYGQISIKLRKVRDQSRFNEKFKKHIPVIIPLWIIPVVACPWMRK
jgi:hypothetical protein